MAARLRRRTFISLGLLSFGSLAFEIGLTRLLSVLYYPPFVYVALSLAVMGIGLGAALAALKPDWAQADRLPLVLALAGGSSLSLVLLMILTAPYPVGPLLIGVMLVPYACVGFALTTIFNHAPRQSRLLYAVDLIGAGAGAVLVIPLLNQFGVIETLLLLGTVFAASGLIFRARPLPLVATVAGLLLAGSHLLTGWLAVDIGATHTEKPIHSVLASGGEILQTRWDAFARTDLVEPADGQPRRIYVDGGAASIIPPAGDNDFLMRDIGLFAFATAQPERVFALGVGGGLDVWFGLRVGADDITAIEVNPQSIQLVREIEPYSGGLFDHPNVTVAVDEGRSVLARSDEQYDLIFLSQVVTLAAERIGYALSENSVFTLEAFREYRDHLTDDGYLAIKLYDELTLSRAMSIVMALYAEDGLSDADALRHVVALLDTSTDPPLPLLMMRKTPFAEDELLSIGGMAQRLGFAPLYLPGIRALPPLDAVERGDRSYNEVIAAAEVDLRAPSDDRPFFYQFEFGIPSDILPLVAIVGGVVSIGTLLLVMLRMRAASVVHLPSAAYFAALGAGFMLAEIALIQQTRLFIGHPTTAITVVLAGVLIGAGLGSAAHSRWVTVSERLSWRIPLIVSACLIAWVLFWPLLYGAFTGAPLPLRIGVVVLALLPLSFAMGIPFPTGLLAIAARGRHQIALAWTINGVMSVAGSVLAVTLAILYGYTAVFMVAIGLYLLAALAARRLV